MDCSTNPINNNSTVDPSQLKAFVVIVQLIQSILKTCDPELCYTEKSIATSSDYQARNSDVDCTIVTRLSN